jgi:hypothetical protein
VNCKLTTNSFWSFFVFNDLEIATSKILTQKKDAKFVELASVFSDYSTKLDFIIFDNSKTKWMELMEDDSNKTIH